MEAGTRQKTYHRSVSYDPRVLITGDGPPVVLVPGLDGTGLLFYRQVEHLAARHRVATFRLRDNAASMATLVSDLGEVVVRMAGEGNGSAPAPVTIVGESFGGALALSFALDHPALVARLVIVNSFPYFAPQARLGLGYHLLRATPWGMMRLVRQLTAFRMHSRHTHRAELRRFHELMRQTTREGYLSRLAILRRYDVRARLPELGIPTLFLAADCDHLVPAVEQAHLMASLIPRSTMRVLSGHGHVCLIAPDLDLAEILAEWMDTER
jgi:pimeloyl-ACP methyl ester carboxylesterase